MIKDMKIENYKLFKSFSLKELPQILLIGGKNNSGKTSILEALFLPLDCSNPIMFLRHFQWRGLHTVSGNLDFLFSPAFKDFDLNKPIVFEYTLNSNKKRLEYKFLKESNQLITATDRNSIELNKDLIRNSSGVEISYWINKKPQKTLLQAVQQNQKLTFGFSKGQEQLRKYNNDVRAVFLSATNPDISKENSRLYSELDVENNTKGILEALQILEPRLSSLSNISLGDEMTIHGDVGIRKKVPIGLMGQGMVRLLSILLRISIFKSGIILVDELENGFHHSFLVNIWEVIAKHAKANNVQLIATTHSKEVISGALKGIPSELRNEFKYMRIEREEENFKTKVYNFENLSVALESELEVR